MYVSRESENTRLFACKNVYTRNHCICLSGGVWGKGIGSWEHVWWFCVFVLQFPNLMRCTFVVQIVQKFSLAQGDAVCLCVYECVYCVLKYHIKSWIMFSLITLSVWMWRRYTRNLVIYQSPAYSSSMSDELPAATRTGGSPSTAFGMAMADDSINTTQGKSIHL